MLAYRIIEGLRKAIRNHLDVANLMIIYDRTKMEFYSLSSSWRIFQPPTNHASVGPTNFIGIFCPIKFLFNIV